MKLSRMRFVAMICVCTSALGCAGTQIREQPNQNEQSGESTQEPAVGSSSIEADNSNSDEHGSVTALVESCGGGDAGACVEASKRDGISTEQVAMLLEQARQVYQQQCDEGTVDGCLRWANLAKGEERATVLRRAADLGDAGAMVNLAELATDGERVKLLNEACALEHAIGCLQLAEASDEVSDKVAAMTKACKLGSRTACDNPFSVDAVSREEIQSGKCTQENVDHLREQVRLAGFVFPSPEYRIESVEMMTLVPWGEKYAYRPFSSGKVGFVLVSVHPSMLRVSVSYPPFCGHPN